MNEDYTCDSNSCNDDTSVRGIFASPFDWNIQKKNALKSDRTNISTYLVMMSQITRENHTGPSMGDHDLAWKWNLLSISRNVGDRLQSLDNMRQDRHNKCLTAQTSQSTQKVGICVTSSCGHLSWIQQVSSKRRPCINFSMLHGSNPNFYLRAKIKHWILPSMMSSCHHQRKNAQQPMQRTGRPWTTSDSWFLKLLFLESHGDTDTSKEPWGPDKIPIL